MTATKQIGPYDYQTLHVRQDRGYQIELYERRRRRLVVSSTGQPRTFLPDHVEPEAWKRWLSPGDKVVEAYQLVPVKDADAQTQKEAPKPVKKTSSAPHNSAFPAAM